jgi:hypothetical protein
VSHAAGKAPSAPTAGRVTQALDALKEQVGVTLGRFIDEFKQKGML